MKSDKGYIFNSIAAQMVLIPIILTVGLIALSDILGQLLKSFSSSGSESDATKFIYILLASFGALIVGVGIGLAFSMLCRNKPDSAKVRYFAPLAPVIYASVFLVFISILSKGDYNSSWWLIYVLKNPLFLIFDIILSFSGLHVIMPIAEITAYSGFFVGILLHELLSKTVIKNKNGTRLRVGFSFLCIAFIVLAWIGARDVIYNGIAELKYGSSTVGSDLTEFDLIKVAPFKEGNGLARLDKKPSIQFTDLKEMPRLDGATAAYPVYAAFVETVYKGLGDYYTANKNSFEKESVTAFVSSSDFPLNIVKCSKTTDAYENLINGNTDIIFVAEPSKAQAESIKARGDEFVLTAIGSEAFVFFTNIKNPVKNLTIQQIQDIYSGKITNWKEIGGQTESIRPYQRVESSGSQTIMENKVMKDIKMLKPTKETFAVGMGEIISKVASYKNTQNSIGYSFMYYSSSMIKNNQIKYVAVNGIKPNSTTVRSKEYPFTVPVYAIYLKSNPNKNVSKLIDWILSDEGQSLVEKTGYVSIK